MLSMDRTTSGDEVVLRVAGELDPHTSPQLDEAFDEVATQGGVKRVVLDASGVQFIDSSGLRVLLAADDALASAGIRLAIRSPSESVRRLLEITDLLEHFDVES